MRAPTLRQRILALFDAELIDAEQMNELLALERYTRESLGLVKARLGESYADFESRKHDVARCRGKQHWWEEFDLELSRRPTGGISWETERCVRCGNVKIIVINGMNRPDRTRYIRPEDFSISGRTSKADWKLLLRRMKLTTRVTELEQQPEQSTTVTSLTDRRRTRPTRTA